MKSMLVIGLLSVVLAVPSIAQTIDEQEIVTVLAKETAIRYSLLFEDWSAQWVQTDYCLLTGHDYQDASPVLYGWEQIAQTTKTWMEHSDRQQYNLDRFNWVIQLDGKLAFATFDQVLSFSNDPSIEIRTKEVRALEKVYGQWKLVHSNSTSYE